MKWVGDWLRFHLLKEMAVTFASQWEEVESLRRDVTFYHGNFDGKRKAPWKGWYDGGRFHRRECFKLPANQRKVIDRWGHE